LQSFDMGVTFSQFYPHNPTLTEQNLTSQKGKVFIVTGGASGIAYHLAAILFEAGEIVYIAGRSEAGARDPLSAGQLEYLHLELDDLNTIKASAEAFKSKEPKLDVLWNNVGVSMPPPGSVSKQGHGLQLAANCLGPYLFTQLLLPPIQAAAQASSQGSVRVVWTSSFVVDLAAPDGGMSMADVTSPSTNQNKNHITSKVGNWFLASELAREVGPHGILSVTQNPGNLKTELLSLTSKWTQLAVSPLLYKPKMGAYTELWAGLSPEPTMEMNAAYVIPWGRIHDLVDALKSVEEGGTGQAGKFRDWCEVETADFK
jgi:NAD(P)-dependent dehydrogenase (short-subunit alcohol dehydrogenase family)